jgi:hypothetical protein
MSKGIGIAIVAAAIAALSLAGVSSAQYVPDGYQPQLRTAANDAAHFPDGYQPQLQMTDVVSRYIDRNSSTSGVGIGRETPDGYQPQLHRPEALPVSGSDDSFDWRVFGIATGSALLLAALGGAALIATRTRGRVAHS